ncbi:hypothetical protein SAMN04489713_104304 [Actinomadura madurae]|uniref:Uncharacterized protein n=1 Tax=Actinomadura madurae TaxID=1993 RepID=A0A1I5EV95_9ACTN|nr:hypothetical protein [Actinomadura madurae]SFO15435.1 hypothetical protein SAMN04489713_104304 [Actinomadura madurae]
MLFSYTGGCDTARGARLTSDGPGRLNMDLTGVTEHGECDTPYKNLAMFAVDKAKAPPGGLTLGGTRTGSPDPVSPGKLVAFEKLAAPPPRSARAAEVSQPDQLEGFLKSLPGARLGGGTPGQRGGRRFAFVLSGCAARTAIMMIDEDRLAAEPVGDGITRCEIAEHYAAVFTVEAQNVPPTGSADQSSALSDSAARGPPTRERVSRTHRPRPQRRCRLPCRFSTLAARMPKASTRRRSRGRRMVSPGAGRFGSVDSQAIIGLVRGQSIR